MKSHKTSRRSEKTKTLTGKRLSRNEGGGGGRGGIINQQCKITMVLNMYQIFSI